MLLLMLLLFLIYIDRAVGDAAEKTGVSIHAILQNPIINPNDLDFVVTTEEVALSNVVAFSKAVEKLDFALSTPLYMPMI